MNPILESLGFLLLVVFAYLLYPPAALGVAGVGLIVAANVRETRRKAEK